jgi:hypothetical protein
LARYIAVSAFDFEAAREGCDQLARDGACIPRRGQATQHERELVAALARHEVAVAYVAPNAFGRVLQKHIAVPPLQIAPSPRFRKG